MNVNSFIERLELALNSKTAYAVGGIGQPSTPKNVERLKQRYDENDFFLSDIVDRKTFLFDCSGLIKGVLWSWNADASKTYGGSVYASTVPDCTANQLFKTHCYDQTNDFSRIDVGEILWCDGHIGVYIGKGRAIECTRFFSGKVLMTTVENCTSVSPFVSNPLIPLIPHRKWTEHGKCKYVDYVGKDITETLIRDVINGKYGVYPERRKKLMDDGYNYYKVQELVNQELKRSRTW